MAFIQLIDSEKGGGRPTRGSTSPRVSPVPRPARSGRLGSPDARRSALLYLAIPLVAGSVAALTVGVDLRDALRYVPTAGVDLLYSFARMGAAYLASLGFALTYGYFAATRRTSERVMIPVLDILQSVPILGFFPVAIVFFASLTPNSWVGPNIASVFLIFTSMAWNMVFGVYESLKSLPAELREAADGFGVRGWQRFREVLLPATVNRLVYNSVLSWTAGFFFLVEAEIFTTNGSALPGIGSYLLFAAERNGTNAFLTGIVLLVILIALLDFAIWRPLGRYAERFRYDTTPSGEVGGATEIRSREGRFRRAATYVTRGVRSGVTRLGTPLVQLATLPFRPGRPRAAAPSTRAYYTTLGVLLVAVWLLLIALGVAVYQIYSGPITGHVRGELLQVPLAMGISALRVASAFLLCLAIAFPLAVGLARRPRAARFGLPTVEVIASFPATALFPAIIFQLVPYLTAGGASLLMLMTGMLWYLFFNLLAGVRSLAPDLEEAARSFGVRGRGFLRRVLLPGIFPALITGSITAFGGGWNTLIVAEYLSVNGRVFSQLGIGQLIVIGYAQQPQGYPLMVTAVLTLVATVIVINELLWKPLYRRAVERYRYD